MCDKTRKQHMLEIFSNDTEAMATRLIRYNSDEGYYTGDFVGYAETEAEAVELETLWLEGRCEA